MAEITIDRSIDEVWGVITDVSSWKTWWGGDLKSVSPGWQVGAAVTWATGGGTTVFDFAEKKRIGLKGSYGERFVWVFDRAPGGRTSVSMGEDLDSSGLVRTSVSASQAEHERTLLQLKDCVESRFPSGGRTGQSIPASAQTAQHSSPEQAEKRPLPKKWWQLWRRKKGTPGTDQLLKAISTHQLAILGGGWEKYNAAVAQIRAEGERGAEALASVLEEMLACRAKDMSMALNAAMKLAPNPNLVSVAQEVLRAEATGPKPAVLKFAPCRSTGSQVAWDSETETWAKLKAKDVLNNWGIK